MKKRNAMILGIVWLMVMVSVAASTLTLWASGRGSENRHWVTDAEYEMIQRYSRMEEVRSALVEKYYQEVDSDALVTGAIQGMMASLGDPYTYYYTPEEMQEYTEENEGVYQGIGILVQSNAQGDVQVSRVYAGGPAEEAGVCAGDLILQVDGVPVSGESDQALDEAVERMKGAEGTDVVFTLRRGDEELEIVVRRGNVSISNVAYSVLSSGIGYINIFQFTGDDVTAFDAALDALEAEPVRGLVIDLRDNPGGALDDVVAIADRLLPEGLIVYTEDRAGAREDYYSDAECSALPLAVIVNGTSASASEILAAAVQDHDRGVLVGEQTFGKGIVQTVVTFEDDGAGMQYTSACYYTPSGKNIHGTGVTPDIEAASQDGFIFDSYAPDPENDFQLRAALDALEARIAVES